MKKTYVISLSALVLAAILGLGLQNSFAGPRGGGGFRDIPLDRAQVKELRQMHRDMEDKYSDMQDLFAEKTVDAGKVKALQGDIQKIRAKMGDFWLNAALAYKQAHPEWQPWFCGPGMGMGMGGMMGGMGMMGGPRHGGYYDQNAAPAPESESE